ncbi:glycosyltransferase family 2 protein [Cognaticolwellia aestuarii]|uniref:glycosyltransferase family 2 protein n=1 Tax=Cognaticolwellia aestuarii TaxID=329993 RepID=UPI00098432AF|nr:glycosyltransferase family 2 protein [Cognaticolwellia aestuarii]
MSYCIVIPNYNHTILLDELITTLCQFELPIIMVNDASHEQAKQLFQDLAAKYDCLSVIEHQINQGKGGAVQTGLSAAYAQGYSHALQVDADGQHDLNDVEKLLSESKKYPQALISGKPIYDESIPKHRYYARNITHFWVWIETLSFKIKDTMCGYRVYPLTATVGLIKQQKLGKRMDFDIEVMVRLFWRNIELRFIDTAVDYPEHGVSHFRALEDNLLISWMHTRLFFGMLIRIPSLLLRKLN